MKPRENATFEANVFSPNHQLNPRNIKKKGTLKTAEEPENFAKN